MPVGHPDRDARRHLDTGVLLRREGWTGEWDWGIVGIEVLKCEGDPGGEANNNNIPS